MTETDDLLHATQRVVGRNYGRWSHADQEDLVSVVLEKYWKTFGDGDGPDNREAWLTTVAQNACPRPGRSASEAVERPLR